MAEIAEKCKSRTRAWETRRAKYGKRGHSGAYRIAPPIYTSPWNARLRSMQNLIVKLHKQGILSEGQASKACGIDRVSLREMADNFEDIHAGCGGVLETHCDTDITAAGTIREYWMKCTKCGGIFDPQEINHG